MRITPDILIKMARSFTAQRINSDKTIVCIYLTGSVVTEENPILGSAADVDLICVHTEEPPAPREMVRLTDDAHLDIAHISQTRFHQPRKLRQDPWLGYYLCNDPLVLHDTAHWFEFTQASVGGQFNIPENVIARARSQADAARQIWMELTTSQATGEPGQMLRYLNAVEMAGNSIALLSGSPLTERRYWLAFPERAQTLGKPELTGELVNLFTTPEEMEADWSAWLHDWQAALTVTSQQPDCPVAIQACRYHYYVSAAQSLLAESRLSALWIMLRTWTLAATHLRSNGPDFRAWHSAFQSMGMQGKDFDARLDAMDHTLDRIEETLDTWAEQNGV